MQAKKSQDQHDSAKKTYNLSRYFPEGTAYFYGYPAGEESHFFNGVPPEIEELVAARPLVCAGPHVKTICFQASLKPFVWDLMHDLGVLNCEKTDVIGLPKEINAHLRGAARNRKIKQALIEQTESKKLVIAQPFLDVRLKEKYSIPSHRIIWLNDKRNLPSYIPHQYTVETYDEFLDGQCFEDCAEQIPLPCVIKVSSSSAGDGVRLCNTQKDIETAKADFLKLEGIILITEWIDMDKNFGVQFGIPENLDEPCEIIAWHEQLVDSNGAFVGGILEPKQKFPWMKTLNKLLLEKILPEVRRRGWFGIGGFDVLKTKDERFYFVDPNFRMTGMTVYDLLVRNGIIKKSLLSFTGTFEGRQNEFEKMITPLAKVGSERQKLYLTSLTEHHGLFRFNAALLFDERRDIPDLAREILSKGIESSVLSRFANHA